MIEDFVKVAGAEENLRLKTFRILGYGTDEMLILLKKCERLETLVLESRLIEGRLLADLDCKFLRRLSLKGTYNIETKALLKFITNCPVLEHVAIDGEQIEMEECAKLIDLLPRK